VVGDSVNSGTGQRKDWNNVDWDNYKEESEQVLTNLPQSGTV